jgi:peptidoglycan/LPS O-acetylase OafA/YrhL
MDTNVKSVPTEAAPRPTTTAIANNAQGRAEVSDRFRPDIEGMRAVAVGLVVLYHGFHVPFTGGFVGVDVFFVISGFLITGLLLHEKARTERISISRFYARRVRRILPAATLVVLATVFATYYWLGFIAGNQIAGDAKWTAVFAANIHFGLLGTDYLGSQLPPSPLQHMWSLGVEEQFYLVWPGLFLGLVLLVRGQRHRNALAIALLGIIGASLAWSVIETRSNATWAYFSPLTRAWELALGALVAVLATVAARVRPSWLIELLSLCGIAGIIVSALVLNSSTHYPGSAVALPVISTALLIAAGCANRRTLVGRALAVRPMQWIGARSYSLYLWHWPFLIIAEEYWGHHLSATQNTGLLLLALAATAITYRLIENPVRHARVLAGRTGLTLAIGDVLITVTVGIAQWQIATAAIVSQRHENTPLAGRSYVTTAQVVEAVKAAEQVQTLPDTLVASLAKDDYSVATGCFDRIDTQKPARLETHQPAGWQIPFGECAYGDRAGTKLMVMYGDSRADTFSAPLELIAAKAGWKLRVFAMGGCEVSDLEHWSYVENAPDKACDAFRSAAISQIRALHPNLVITTSAGAYRLADGTWPTPAQQQDAWVPTFQKLSQPGTRLAMIGPIPQWPNNDERCLAAHVRDVQACSIATADLDTPKYEAPQAAAAAAAGVVFVSPRPWVCADRCEPVIADNLVFSGPYHFSRTYAMYLTGALSEALQPAMT